MMRNDIPTTINSRYYRFSQFQIAKAYWKLIEKEWSDWLINTQSEINISEHTILNTIYIHGTLPITELSVLGMMHVSTALNFSKNLEKKGLLKSEKNMKDRRKTLISLTDLGKQKIEKIENEWHASQSELLMDIMDLEQDSGTQLDFSDLVSILRTSYGSERIDNILDKEKWNQTIGAFQSL